MAQITVKYDPTIKIEEIEEPMYATSENESPEDKPAEVQQTKMTGILAPLIKVNNIILLWDKVTRFELSSTGFLPELSFTFKDDLGFTKSLDQPGNDNLVLLQILPPFDDAYKKINLRFFINDIKISGEKVTVFAKYNVPELYQDRIKSYGKMTTYDLVDTIAKNSQLGFAANVEGTDDTRFMFLANENYISALSKEISFSGNKDCILATWIDFHNYIILCDILERYRAIDSDIKVWTAPTVIPDTENTGNPIKPKQEDAILSNSIAVRNSQLYITDYTVKNNAGKNMSSGTDKVLQFYNAGKTDEDTSLIQDGDVKKDVFVKTVYRGEVYGDYDYFSHETCRKAVLQKINSNMIEVSLRTPLLGLERGGKVDVMWYDTNELLTVQKNENPIETNTSDDSTDADENLQTMTINKQVSGQYLIVGTRIRFKGFDKGWQYTLLLARPADMVNKYLDDNDE